MELSDNWVEEEFADLRKENAELKLTVAFLESRILAAETYIKTIRVLANEYPIYNP